MPLIWQSRQSGKSGVPSSSSWRMAVWSTFGVGKSLPTHVYTCLHCTDPRTGGNVGVRGEEGRKSSSGDLNINELQITSAKRPQTILFSSHRHFQSFIPNPFLFPSSSSPPTPPHTPTLPHSPYEVYSGVEQGRCDDGRKQRRWGSANKVSQEWQNSTLAIKKPNTRFP